MNVRVTTIGDGDLHCSACGLIADDDPCLTRRNAAWNHLLDAHRDLLVDAHSEVAVRTAEQMTR